MSNIPVASHFTRQASRMTPKKAIHFGLEVRAGSKYSLRLTRDTYAQINKRSSMPNFRELMSDAQWSSEACYYDDDLHRYYTDEYCLDIQATALRNFDLNIEFFKSLDHAQFSQAMADTFLAHDEMVGVADLNKWHDKPALYIMILDDYCQAYVGVTKGRGGLKARIRQHWSGNKQFDRLVYGHESESRLSINSFRALDTTQIFAIETRDAYDLEYLILESIPDEYLLNRISGGSGLFLAIRSILGEDINKRRLFSKHF